MTALVTATGALFCLFFQISKAGPFRDANPFGDDPYDAVGSIAIQLAFLVGMLTFARALRLRESPSEAGKTRLIFRGNITVLSAVFLTLIADAIAESIRPLPPSYWGNVLLLGLGLLFLLTMLSAGALAIVFRKTLAPAPPHDLNLADGIDDLWTLVRVPVTAARGILPSALVERVRRFECDQLFAGFPWVHPRRHPWRFACALGLLVGLGLCLAQLQEGLPPSLKIGLLVAGIFLSVELTLTLLGFAALGGYLGLRVHLVRRP